MCMSSSRVGVTSCQLPISLLWGQACPLWGQGTQSLLLSPPCSPIVRSVPRMLMCLWRLGVRGILGLDESSALGALGSSHGQGLLSLSQLLNRSKCRGNVWGQGLWVRGPKRTATYLSVQDCRHAQKCSKHWMSKAKNCSNMDSCLFLFCIQVKTVRKSVRKNECQYGAVQNFQILEAEFSAILGILVESWENLCPKRYTWWVRPWKQTDLGVLGFTEES